MDDGKGANTAGKPTSQRVDRGGTRNNRKDRYLLPAYHPMMWDCSRRRLAGVRRLAKKQAWLRAALISEWMMTARMAAGEGNGRGRLAYDSSRRLQSSDDLAGCGLSYPSRHGVHHGSLLSGR